MTLYETLGVAPSASQDEIKRAYRKLARELHPDRTRGDQDKAARMAEVNAAYDVLSDDRRRSDYDLSLVEPVPEVEQDEGASFHAPIFDVREMFGEDVENLVERVRREGISMDNLESLASDFKRTAQRLKEDFPRKVGREPGQSSLDLEDIVRKRFGIDLEQVDIGKIGKMFGKIFHDE